MDDGATKANPALRGKRSAEAEAAAALAEGTLDRLAFDQEKLMQYIWSRPLDMFFRTIYLAWLAAGIYWAWKEDEEGAQEARSVEYVATLTRTRPASKRGEALRSGLAEMGVFFVKIGQTMAQRPDLVGDELAEELKGLQERNAPFDDAIAHKIIAEDLAHNGPLAPGVFPEGCDLSHPPLLAELGPKHVASASLGQVYRGRLFDGREVALKVQRPGVRAVIGLDWAVAVLVCRFYVWYTEGPNDYTLVVDTVTQGIRKELDYHNEAANLEEFAARHTFLPFVSSPGWIKELTGPEGCARVLAMNWYPSRAPKELTREERRDLVEMAVEACVVQLLITGFVHADPHEGNLRMGDDGRCVFLDFGLMDRVDFGVMECFAAGIRCVLAEDWVELTRIMQQVRFTPTPLLRRIPRKGWRGRILYDLEKCEREDFAKALGSYMNEVEGGMARFGAMAVALKKMSNEYVMLTPPYVALLCRTFITLEGLLADDPAMATEYNIYEVAFPFALRRLLSPRTRRGQAELREALLLNDLTRPPGEPRKINWSALADLLGGEAAEGSDAAGSSSSMQDTFGAAEAVQRRLLRTTEGAALRRFLYEVDLFQSLRDFLASPESRPLRLKVIDALAQRWATSQKQAASRKHSRRRVQEFGPRSDAASSSWGAWRIEDPYRLPPAALRRSRAAWKVVLRRQLHYALRPRWRLPYRATVGLGGVLVGVGSMVFRALVRAAFLRWRSRAARSAALAVPSRAIGTGGAAGGGAA